MAVDGSIIIDTQLDHAGIDKGISAMKSAVSAGAVAVVALITSMSVAVVSLGSEFEQANAKASTLFGNANVNMQQYSSDMLELSNKSGLAATELGNTMYDALSAGIPASDDMSDALGFLEKNTRLAKAGFTDVNTATTATAKVLNAYKMDVGETDRVHKILMQTQNLGITTVNELGSVLSQVTPTASAMSVSFEQVGAALANMTAQGTPTAQATTQLNGLIAELGKSGTIGSEAMLKAAEGTQYAGKSFSQLMKEGVPLNAILDVMSTYADKNNLSMIDMFSSIEAGKAALAVSGQNSEQFTKNLSAMSTECDVVGDAYDKVTDTFQEKSKKVVNSFKNVGIAAYEKFQEPLKGAMDSAQQSVDSLSKEMGSGKLGESVDKIADGFAELITVATKLASKAIPLIVNGFAFMVDHGEELVVALVAVGGAMAAMKVQSTFIAPMMAAKKAAEAYNVALVASSISGVAFNGTLTIGQVAVGLLTGQISLATAAQAAWNAMKALDPTMMVVMAVGALAAGIVALCVTMDSEQKQHEETMETIEGELQAREDLKQKQNEQLSANLGEIANTQSLSNELKNLADANGVVKSGYEARAGFIVGELNSALGLNMALTNGEISGYKDLSTSIDDMIAKRRAEIILESQLPAYKDAVTKSIKAQTEANRINAELTDLNNQSMALEAEMIARYGENWKNSYEALSSTQGQAWSNLQYDTILKQAEYDKQNQLVQGYYTDISSYETNATLIASGNAAEYAKVQTSVLASRQTTTQGQIQASNDTIMADQGYIDFLKGTYAIEIDESKKNALKAQIEAKEGAIKAEQEKIDGLTATIINKGPEYNAEVKRLANEALGSFSGDTQLYFGVSREKLDNVISGLNSKDGDVKAKAEAEAQTMLDGLKSKDDEYSKAGANVLDGIINGSNSKSGDLYSTMANYGSQMLANFKSSLGIKSPSRKFAELSKFIPEGIAKGIDENAYVAEKSIEGISDSLMSSFDNTNLIDAFSSQFTQSQLDELLRPLEEAVLSSQYQMQSTVNGSIQHEILKSAEKRVEQQPLKAILNGVIQSKLIVDGREFVAQLAPMFSEEIAFKTGR